MSVRSVRLHLLVPAVLSVALLAAGCGGSGDQSGPSTSASDGSAGSNGTTKDEGSIAASKELDGITVTAAKGAAPVVKMPKTPFTAERGFRVITPGTGAQLTKDSILTVQYALVSGKTGATLEASKADATSLRLNEASLLAGIRPENVHPALAQHGNIGLHRRMCPHLLVHRRRGIQRCSTGQAQRGQQIVGQSVRQPREQISAGRCDHDALSPARQFDMSHCRFGLRIPQAGADGLAGQRLKCRRTDKMRGTFRHHHAHLCPDLVQPTHQVASFVGGDPAGYAQQDTAVGKTHVGTT